MKSLLIAVALSFSLLGTPASAETACEKGSLTELIKLAESVDAAPAKIIQGGELKALGAIMVREIPGFYLEADTVKVALIDLPDGERSYFAEFDAKDCFITGGFGPTEMLKVLLSKISAELDS